MTSKKLLRYSEVESRRFDLHVSRGEVDSIDQKALLEELLADRVDLAILRLPSERQHELSRLDRVALPYLVADTLVYYFVDLRQWKPRELRNPELEFIDLGPETIPVLDALVEEIFGDYSNHYAANPLLSQTGRIEGYKEWARSFARGGDRGAFGFVVRRGSEWVGFCTCGRDGTSGTGVLYGIRSSAVGGGLYGDMIRYTQSHLRSIGCHEMEVSTQVHNFAVQKVWSREGFSIKKALVTAHVNSMFRKSVVGPYSERFTVSEEEISSWMTVSGDDNPLHRSDEFARARGLESRVAHGLIAVGRISRFFGTVFPGPGTLFQGYTYGFFRPIYPGREYKAHFSFPIGDDAKGYFRAVTRITDAEENLCLHAYSNLIRR